MRGFASSPQPCASSLRALRRNDAQFGELSRTNAWYTRCSYFPTKGKAWEKGWASSGRRIGAVGRCSHVRYGDDMQDNVDNERNERRTTRAGVLLSLAIGACVTLPASGCSKSHVQETVAPRAATTQAHATKATMVTSSNSAAPAVSIEAEAAGDELAHAVVALKARRRADALYYMNLARTRLNRIAAGTNAKSNPTHERIFIVLSELDTAERGLRHNA